LQLLQGANLVPALYARAKNEFGFLWDKRRRLLKHKRFKLLPGGHDLFAHPLTLRRIMR
jgi:hypothetical protein